MKVVNENVLDHYIKITCKKKKMYIAFNDRHWLKPKKQNQIEMLIL